jgi:ribosomal protein S18 acetylase RimI-like enzyme
MIRYRLANHEDNHQLIALTAATGMTGETALRIDRHPDFFKLLEMRGKSLVFVALDTNTIIGSLCASLQQVYVGGEICPLYYIGDFKVAAPYRNRGVGLRLCDELADHIVLQGADLAFLNVSKGNSKPFSFFKNRSHIPDFANIGIFKIHQFIGKRKKIVHPAYKIEETPVTEELIKFLDTYQSRYELGCPVTKEKLQDGRLFTVRHHSQIIAAMCLMDTMKIKQNVAMKLPVKLKYGLKILNFLHGISGISKMPLINEPIRMIYIKYLAVDNRQKSLVKLLIHHARNIVYDQSYSFASIGLHEKDPLHDCFTGLLKLTFNSIGMLVSIKNNHSLIEKIRQGIPFEDYSLV